MSSTLNGPEEKVEHQERGERAQRAGESLTPMQVFYLERLERLVRLGVSHREDGDSEEWVRRVIDRALYSTFLDCQEQGVEAEAKTLLAGEHSSH